MRIFISGVSTNNDRVANQAVIEHDVSIIEIGNRTISAKMTSKAFNLLSKPVNQKPQSNMISLLLILKQDDIDQDDNVVNQAITAHKIIEI